MNITERVAKIAEAHRERARRARTANYDHCRLYPNHFGATPKVTIGQAKAQRLRIKNLRRAENGLPPKATYAEI